jgi:hypothetical protein
MSHECTNCGEEIPPDAKRCPACKAMNRRCPICGEPALIRVHRLQTKAEIVTTLVLFAFGFVPGIAYGSIITLYPFCTECKRRVYRLGASFEQERDMGRVGEGDIL